MTALLSAAGRSFVRAFAAALLVYGTGIFNQPDMHGAVLVGIAAVLAAITAGIRALQAYVPALTFARYLPSPYGNWVDSALRAFLGSLCITLPGVLAAPDLNTGKSLAVAAVVGALAAAWHALQDILTPGVNPNPQSGLPTPPGLQPVDPGRPQPSPHP